MGQWVVQLNGTLLDFTPISYRFAMGAGIAFTDDVYVPAGLMKWQGPTQKIVVGADGIVQSQVDVGEVQIANFPSDIGSAGPWDALIGYAWQHSLAQLYWCPDTTWANAVLVSQSQLMQPVANLSTAAQVTSILRFPLRDPRSQLNTALQKKKFAGDNATVGLYGVEGDADLKGTPQPVMYGIVSNIPGVIVNKELFVYFLADVAVSVLCVRDGGIPLTAGTSRATVASLMANTPPVGGYDYAATATGTYVRLGTQPLYRVTFDAAEGATAAARTHPQIWSRLRQARCGTPSINIDTTSVTACDALDGNEVGFWWTSGTCKDAVDEVLASLSGYEVKDTVTKKFSITKLLAPSGTPLVNLCLLSDTAELKSTDRPLMKLDRVQPSYLPDGIPPYRVNVQWGKNYTVQTAADLSPIAANQLKVKFATEWRTESDHDDTVWQLYFAANEMTIPTGYQPGADTITCPHAATEAARIRALYTADKPSYQATFRPEATDIIEAGQVLRLTYPMYGLSGGKLFRVMQAQDIVDNGQRTTTVVLGLQT